MFLQILRILHLSDTHSCHNRLRDLPEADVVVHSGDFTMNGREQEALDFLKWFCDLPYSQKIFICGNHDDCLYGANIEGLDPNVHYLCNAGVVIDGVKFYGVPMFMENCATGCQNRNYAIIPDDTDILITHSPAYGILDLDNAINYGSEELLTHISTINLKAHLFGHIHAQYGMTKINDTIFSNGSIMNPDYVPVNTPNVIDIQ